MREGNGLDPKLCIRKQCRRKTKQKKDTQLTGSPSWKSCQSCREDTRKPLTVLGVLECRIKGQEFDGGDERYSTRTVKIYQSFVHYILQVLFVQIDRNRMYKMRWRGNCFFTYSLISHHRTSFGYPKSAFGLTKILIFHTFPPCQQYSTNYTDSHRICNPASDLLMVLKRPFHFLFPP